jgi:transcriptional regulator
MTERTINFLRDTVDLLILKALTWEPRHGYAVSEWLQAVTGGTLLVEEGTLYPALHRLEAKGLIRAEWGLSENNRRAKYYALTRAGRRRLELETSAWRRHADAVAATLAAERPGT